MASCQRTSSSRSTESTRGSEKRLPAKRSSGLEKARRQNRDGSDVTKTSSDLPVYPETKDAGAEWLGRVPAHWEVTKLRHVLHARAADRNRPDLPLLSVVREKGVIVRDTSPHSDNHNFIPDDLTNYKVVRRGQFALNKMKAWQGSYGVSNHDGIVSPAYFVFRLTQRIHNAYFHAAVRSRTYVSFFAQASDGVRVGQWDLSAPQMREIPLLIPPRPEQAAIARFLDHVDGRIRRAIREKQKLLALLEEQRLAVIKQAVTGQIDVRTGRPYPAYKDSGVQWLNRVPAHWEVTKLRHVLHARAADRNRPDLPLLSVVREKGVIVRDTSPHSDNHNFIPDDLTNYKVVRRGQFALNKMKAWQGSYGVSNHDGIVSPAYFVFRLTQRIHNAYFHAAVRSRTYVSFFAQASDGVRVGQWDLSAPQMREIPLLIPPRPEQAAITRYADRVTADTAAAKDRADRQITLLREYRIRLIADVVTGKVDVREAAANLPKIDPLDTVSSGATTAGGA